MFHLYISDIFLSVDGLNGQLVNISVDKYLNIILQISILIRLVVAQRLRRLCGVQTTFYRVNTSQVVSLDGAE